MRGIPLFGRGALPFWEGPVTSACKGRKAGEEEETEYQMFAQISMLRFNQEALNAFITPGKQVTARTLSNRASCAIAKPKQQCKPPLDMKRGVIKAALQVPASEPTSTILAIESFGLSGVQ